MAITGNDGTVRPGYTTERVEIAPGRFIKMNEADKKAWLASQPAAAQNAVPEQATAAAPETATMPKPKQSTKRY